jgi:hypothetical protein
MCSSCLWLDVNFHSFQHQDSVNMRRCIIFKCLITLHLFKSPVGGGGGGNIHRPFKK